MQIPNTKDSYTISSTNGFWVFDQKLLESGKPFNVNKDYLEREGKPYLVTGTTYMGSDVHRKFLFEPNPFLWNKDFAEMKAAGVNMVRTGIWTAWRNYMLDVGAPNEAALRALDAFILMARKYDIPVIFTFFVFLPETWGGINAYLDPRSVNAQKVFLTLIAHRYSGVNDLIWDLINEPSFCNPQQLWTTRPNYDKYEIEAWNKWLKTKYQSHSDEELTSKLQEYYRLTPDEPLSLPALEDFADVNIFNEHRPLKVVDYRLFAQEMFNNWVKQMTEAIRSNGNPRQLVTVGQDEGGTYERPNPQFFAEVVDFTCLHNWWLNDDLVWDNIVTKATGKPNLVEETGVMFYEKTDGSAWRTEDEARNLLERKLAISIGAGGAGFIEWIWNTNPFMKSDNEAAIGLHRVDGTVKPELEPIIRFSKFFAENKHLMVRKRDEDIVMVIPHSQMWLTRNNATEATRRCVRAMCYRCMVTMNAVSEYQVHTLTTVPKLIVVPAPRTLHEQAWNSLRALVEQGSTLLITGVFEDDEHWIPMGRFKQLGIDADIRPVAQHEILVIDGKEYELNYRGEKIQRIEKAVVRNDSSGNIFTFPYGLGAIIWSPLPVELAEDIDPTVALYTHVLKQAKCSPIFTPEKNDPSVLILPLVYDKVVLYTFVSECDRDMNIRLTHMESNTIIDVNVPAQRTLLIFLSRNDGKIISRM